MHQTNKCIRICIQTIHSKHDDRNNLSYGSDWKNFSRISNFFTGRQSVYYRDINAKKIYMLIALNQPIGHATIQIHLCFITAG